MVDIIGTSAVANMIEQSGLSRFTIGRTGMHKNYVPIYEYLRGGSVKNTVEAFRNWANTVLSGGENSNEYEIFLFEDVEEERDEDGSVEVKRSKKKSGKMRFTFQLTSRNSIGVINGVERHEETKNVSELIEQAVRLALAERDKADLTKKLSDLEKRIAEMEEEEDDDEQDETGHDKALQILSGLMPMITGKKQDVVVNGVGETETANKITQEQIVNINKAVKILAKYDDQIDTDLLKLAAVAQANPSQFQFLLNALRNM